MKNWVFSITADFACVFDMLTILQVKQANAAESNVKNEIALKIKQLENQIIKRMGFKTFQQVILSPEFNNLYEANLEVYNSVNIAEEDKDGKILTAHQLNNINKNRTKAKRALMQKFCGNTGEEVKLGSSGQII